MEIANDRDLLSQIVYSAGQYIVCITILVSSGATSGAAADYFEAAGRSVAAWRAIEATGCAG